MTESLTKRAESGAVERRRELVLAEVLAGNGNVRALSESLRVSEATIRRDLVALSRAGMATRTYGGAIARPRQLELSLHEKESLHPDRKEVIARRAVDLVTVGDTVILDAGTTIGQLARQLAADSSDLTVVTNGLSSIRALASADAIELICVGGTLRHIGQAFVGPLAEALLERLSADVAFLGADGVTERGLCCPTAQHASLKRMMASRASKTYVLCDSSKLGHAPHHHWTPWNQGWTLVTDSRASTAQVQLLEEAGLSVEIAG